MNLITIKPEPINISTAWAGTAFANSDGNKQSEFLLAWLEATKYFPWAMQCRTIAECLPEESMIPIRVMLETLIEHLEAIPIERATAAATDRIIADVQQLVTEAKS